MFVRLICWKEDLARERQALLESAGFKVESSRTPPGAIVGHIRDLAPDVVLLDLDRSPSHGHAIASVLRQSRSACRVPLVFAGGLPEKVAVIRRAIPDAVYCSWDGVAAAVKKAVKNPPAVPVRPEPYMQKYAGSPLLKKLDIRSSMTVAVIAAPEGFEDLLGELPDGVTLQNRMTKEAGLAIWFVRSLRELEATADYLGGRLQKGGSAWIVYPKKTGQFKVDFNMNHIRATMLEADLVDYKICAVDPDWTALKFTRKRAK
jgi:CheY-like chemotaxis protein